MAGAGLLLDALLSVVAVSLLPLLLLLPLVGMVVVVSGASSGGCIANALGSTAADSGISSTFFTESVIFVLLLLLLAGLVVSCPGASSSIGCFVLVVM